MAWHSCLYTGFVMHRRLAPRRHQFRYRVFAMLLDLDELAALDRSLRLFGWNRWAPFSFHDRDHGDGGGLKAWLDGLLARAGIRADGPRRVLCYPRILGYVFNPLSVWFCHDASGTLKAIVYEVHNTFEERHAYVLAVPDPSAGRAAQRNVVHQECAKDFYVSPFLARDCRYHFRIVPPGETAAIAIHETEGGHGVLDASFAGKRRALDDRALLKMLLTYPLMTLKVIVAIHFEAVRLMVKGIGRHPHAPQREYARM